MATITQARNGHWRVQVRRKGKYASQTFRLKTEATIWARDIEHHIDQGKDVTSPQAREATTIGHIVNLHIADMKEIGKPIRRSKRAVLGALKLDLGAIKIRYLDRSRLIQYGKKRAQQGAGPVTLAVDFSYLRTVLTHAAAIHGITVNTECIHLARIALSRLGLIGKSHERDRRPTQAEIDVILKYFDNTPTIIPMARIIRFAIASAMRQDEICRIAWEDVNLATNVLIIRDRKDPRRKDGNHQKVPLLDLAGYDAWKLLLEQKLLTNGRGRVFPYNPQSVGTAFRRARKATGIEDLRFHDLRHEATSRFFEAGLTIEKVALVTGHRDWKMLRRYTHLKPENLSSLRITPHIDEQEYMRKLSVN